MKTIHLDDLPAGSRASLVKTRMTRGEAAAREELWVHEFCLEKGLDTHAVEQLLNRARRQDPHEDFRES